MNRLSASIGVLLAAAAASAASAAGFTPTAQERSIEWGGVHYSADYLLGNPVSEETTTDGGADAAPGFGPYDAWLAGIVEQTSSITPWAVSGRGSHDADGYVNVHAQTPVLVVSTDDWTSRSSFSLDFDVAGPTPLVLSGSITVRGGHSDSLARVRLLDGPGTEPHAVQLVRDVSCAAASCYEVVRSPIQVVGVLDPGSYTLEAEIDGATSTVADVSSGTWIGGGYGGSYALELAIGGPAAVPIVPGPLAVVLGLSGVWLLGAHRSLRRSRVTRDGA